MEWIRIEAGEYWSKDDRFQILKVWDRIYGSHWNLSDGKTNNNYPCDTLKQCKQKVEVIV